MAGFIRARMPSWGPTLTTSCNPNPCQRPHLQIPLHWGLGLQLSGFWKGISVLVTCSTHMLSEMHTVLLGFPALELGPQGCSEQGCRCPLVQKMLAGPPSCHDPSPSRPSHPYAAAQFLSSCLLSGILSLHLRGPLGGTLD